MPYLTRERKHELDAGAEAENGGELNYRITCLLIDFKNKWEPSYGILNTVLGALEGAKAEFYRRVVVPYEEGAKDRNGDVY